MSATIRVIWSIGISSSTAEENDLGKGKQEFVNSASNEGGTWLTQLATSATDVQLNLGNLASVKFLAIKTKAHDPTQTPSAITIKRNSNVGEAQTIDILTGGKEGIYMISTTGLTAVYATNLSGSVPMDVIVYAIGD